MAAAHPHPQEADEQHPEPIARDPGLPDVSDTTLMFFAAGSLAVTAVALAMLLD